MKMKTKKDSKTVLNAENIREKTNKKRDFRPLKLKLRLCCEYVGRISLKGFVIRNQKQ